MDPIEQLHRRPGVMIRRAHQIASSIFAEETASLGITSTQYGVMVIVGARPGLDQATLAGLLGLDPATTGMVVNTLQSAGYIDRTVETNDRRRRRLRLTTTGSELLERTERPAGRAIKRLLEPLSSAEQETLTALLHKLTSALNEVSRIPVRFPRTGPDGHPAAPDETKPNGPPPCAK